MRNQFDVVVESWAALPVHDVSLGGLRISMPVAPRIGEHLSIAMTLPNGLQLQLAAEVRYAGPRRNDQMHTVGLRWTDAEEADLLRELVDAVAALG